MKLLTRIIKLCLLFIFLTFIYKQLNPYLAQSISLLTNVSILRLLPFIFLSSLPYLIAGICFTLLARHYHSFSFGDGIKVAYLTMFTENTLGSFPAKIVPLIWLHQNHFTLHESLTIVVYDFLNYQIPTFIFSLLPFFPGNSFFFITYPLEIYPALLGACFDFFPLLLLIILLSSIKLPSFILTFYHHFKQRLPLSSLTFNKIAIHKYSDINIILLLLNIIRLLIRNALPLFSMITLQINISSNQIITLWLASIFLELLLSIIPFAGKHGVSESCFIIIYTPFLNKPNAIGAMLLWRLCFYYLNTLLGAITFLCSKHVSFHEIIHIKNYSKL